VPVAACSRLQYNIYDAEVKSMLGFIGTFSVLEYNYNSKIEIDTFSRDPRRFRDIAKLYIKS